MPQKVTETKKSGIGTLIGWIVGSLIGAAIVVGLVSGIIWWLVPVATAGAVAPTFVQSLAVSGLAFLAGQILGSGRK